MVLEILFGGTTIFQTYFSHYEVGVMGFVSLCITITLLIFSSHNTKRTSNSSDYCCVEKATVVRIQVQAHKVAGKIYIENYLKNTAVGMVPGCKNMYC